MFTRSIYISICLLLLSFPIAAAQETPGKSQVLTFVGLDFDFERGSLIATYKSSDATRISIRIVGPKNPEKIARVRIERSEHSGSSEDFKRMSRKQCREFVVERLLGRDELTQIERDFLAVLTIQNDRVTPIRHFGMGGFAAIKEGKWEAVFRDPKNKATGGAFGDDK